MKITVTGRTNEVADTVDALRGALDVTSVVATYPTSAGRQDTVRADLDATTKPRTGGAR